MKWIEKHIETLVLIFIVLLIFSILFYRIGYESGTNEGYNRANLMNKEDFSKTATSSCGDDPLQYDCF